MSYDDDDLDIYSDYSEPEDVELDILRTCEAEVISIVGDEFSLLYIQQACEQANGDVDTALDLLYNDEVILPEQSISATLEPSDLDSCISIPTLQDTKQKASLSSFGEIISSVSN
ncbi:hypothetical protein GEMRC1_006955 [Eukaryota sp. GEM-RC1]